MFRCDDILLCCGATWTLSHAAATAALRQQGVRVIRMIYDLIPTLKAAVGVTITSPGDHPVGSEDTD